MKHRLALVIAIALPLLLGACYSGSHPGQIGSMAPDFTLQDGAKTISLHDYRGKVVVLNFWATWCPPCVEEMPSLVQLQKNMGDRVTVLAVSVDVDGNAFRDFVAKRKVDLLAVRDADQKSNSLYGTYKFPETYVIDREGKIRRKFIGAVNWTDPDIEKYLAGL